MYIRRDITPLVESRLNQGRAIVIYGPRRVGKTTLVQNLLVGRPDSLYLNCDEPDIREKLTNRTSTELKSLIGNQSLVVIDEAQRVANIGLTLKLLVDNFPRLQVIATGSSSFELSNSLKEPLTGRAFEFLLLPFSISELSAATSRLEESRLLEERLLYGAYPEILASSMDQRIEKISLLANNYLYKDVLSFGKIRNAEVLQKLLQALALQVGQEVSYNELGSLLQIDKSTVASYIDLLQKSFVLFPLLPLSRNPRKELSKKRKIYFFDLGIRNALIRNFNPVDLRNDTGALWENFLLVERYKRHLSENSFVNSFFWRSYNQQEIDLVEEKNGHLAGFEFKFSAHKSSPPSGFVQLYPDSTVRLINQQNYLDFVLPEKTDEKTN